MGDRLTGKVAVVTGAGSGIGRATAQRFCEEGASVVVADVDEQGGRDTLQQIEAAGGTAQFIAVDVADAGQVEQVVERFDKLDILVNSAATLINTPLLQDTAEADWDV